MKRIVMGLLLVASVLAEQPGGLKRPACNAASRGRFWPEAANTDAATARKLSQCGSLEICAYGTWRYNWQPMSVTIRQLGKPHGQPTAECAALLSSPTAPDRSPSTRPLPPSPGDPSPAN